MSAQPGENPGDTPEAGDERLPYNTNPNLLVDGYNTATELIVSYGWFILAGVILVMFIFYKLKPKIEQLQERREEQQYYKKYDAGTALLRQEAMDAARRRLQEEHDHKAAQYAARQQELEEKKRVERIDDWDRHQQGRGYRSKVKRTEDGTSAPGPASGSSGTKPKKPLRDPDYNPLMGASGGACYRPARRGGAGGG